MSGASGSGQDYAPGVETQALRRVHSWKKNPSASFFGGNIAALSMEGNVGHLQHETKDHWINAEVLSSTKGCI
jgi:hypothetical protein